LPGQFSKYWQFPNTLSIFKMMQYNSQREAFQ